MASMQGSESHAALMARLREMSKQLAATNPSSETIHEEIQQLKQITGGRPDTITDVLTPFLFRPPSNDGSGDLSNSEALSLLVYLVSVDHASFLKPASRSVHKTALLLLASPEQTMAVSPDLLHTIVAQITGSDVEVSTNATGTIVACCKKLGPSLVEPVFVAILSAWKQAWQGIAGNRTIASTLCVRCASAVVDLILALDDASTMSLAQQTEALPLLLEMMQNTKDPLLQMSMVDLIETLSGQYPISHERGKWLFSNAVLDPMFVMAGGMEEEGEPDPILGGPALRVVAALCKIAGHEPQPGETTTNWFQVNDSQRLLNGFHHALQKFDTHTELDRLVVVDAVSSFAMASSGAFELVINDPNTRHTWLSLKVAQSKLKAAILFSIAMVLKHPFVESSQQSDTSAGLKKQLYAMLGQVNGPSQDTTELVVSLAQVPFPEVRLSAYNLLTVVASHIPTGAQILLQNSSFFSMVLGDQNDLERTKEGREAKYEIVRAVYNSDARALLADAIVKKLEKLIQQGPHYIKPQTWELATE